MKIPHRSFVMRLKSLIGKMIYTKRPKGVLFSNVHLEYLNKISFIKKNKSGILFHFILFYFISF